MKTLLLIASCSFNPFRTLLNSLLVLSILGGIPPKMVLVFSWDGSPTDEC